MGMWVIGKPTGTKKLVVMLNGRIQYRRQEETPQLCKYHDQMAMDEHRLLVCQNLFPLLQEL